MNEILLIWLAGLSMALLALVIIPGALDSVTEGVIDIITTTPVLIIVVVMMVCMGFKIATEELK